ncbi:UTP--glucose-1-phosphate uridylyltransferase [Candidatus Berkelbacteria bacterium CG10_big_fil_rev_8_21_14_0_10_41_12]|uniref:UTP--glucose-1-phosphate uridylyltransferase n=1 Tax=Candidatus Berkelbacteria bacterium CG10_big_fil_rev_8_21_14_0_10_41_12 TaxID=1974513 RepID=A0A2M6WXK7_9BACT|nr:MAG: UTP--glucose-1-phosphate uridylyltransferase [Candidatus Berkelbacteria bacterium CG10_big_fil_rev_8_21_14_0_10_41_12]
MKIRKAVFPVAGLGTRFLPATKAQPKEMLPLVDKPIIQYSVEEAAAAGITQMIMVTGKGKRAIEDHFDSAYELEEVLRSKNKDDLLRQVEDISRLGKFIYVRQQQPPLGLGHAVLMAREIIGDDAYFAVFYPDDVMNCPTPCIGQMMEIFAQNNGGIIAVKETDEEGQKRYGIAAVEPTDNPRLFKITDVVEKPGPENAPSNLAIMGRLILPKEIFDELEGAKAGIGGEIQLTDSIRSLIKKMPFYAYKFEGEALDAGEILGYLESTVKLAIKRKDIGEQFRNLLRQILDKNSEG